jgi:hypothetical protein
MNPCDLVIERVALGEPLGKLSEHVTSCARCQRIVAMPGRLGATRHASEPGHGFAARMTVGAQHLIVVRRRRRLAAGLAATVAAGVLGVFVVTRSPDEPQQRAAVELPQPVKDNQPVAADEADLDMLVRLADTRRARRVSAPWGRIQKPLKPYMQLVKGVTQ